MKECTLVVMAAGMGSRFGGLKQITPVDEEKNFIIDYSVYDAKKAGFTKVVFVIKEENLNLFTKVEIYAIYTNNYIYIFDTKIVDTIYDDKETDILMLNADVNPLKSIFNIDENATITFLIDYYNKKDNSETKSYKLTYKIDLKNKSIEFLNPNDVTVG